MCLQNNWAGKPNKEEIYETCVIRFTGEPCQR